jgi:hypothetical protein
MKRIAIILGFLVLMGFCNAQVNITMFGVGYNASFVNPKTANLVLQRYDDTRAYLTDPMGQIKYMDGINWNFHWIYQAFMMDFNYNKRVNVRSASGDGGYGPFQRDLKFKSSSFSLGFGINLVNEAPYIGIGFNFDAGANRVDSRIEDPELIRKTDYEELEKQLMFGGSIWGQLLLCSKNDSGVGLVIRPYYHFDFIGTNYQWLNEEINPATAANDTFDPYGKMNHLGLQVTFVFVVPDLY